MRFCTLILVAFLSALTLNSQLEDARSLLIATLAKYAHPISWYADATPEGRKPMI